MTNGRVLARAAALLAACAALRGVARADALPSRVDVRADGVAFYPYQNLVLLAAEGHVVVQAGARTIRGRTLRYDVIGNKLVVTGDVVVRHAERTLSCEAYALDLPSGDSEVVRIDEGPATFAIHEDDPASAKAGPPATDVFAQPNIDGARPYIRSRHAIVTPGAGVRMSPAEFPTSLGPSARLPTFFYTIVQNQNITQSSLPGSTFDQPLNLTGTPGSLLAAHLRYDSTYGATLAFDERLVNRTKSYAVVSLLPLRDRQIDALGFEAIAPGLQQTISTTHTIGANPYTAASYKLQHSDAFTTQTLQSDVSNYNNDLGLDVASKTHDVGHYFGYQVHAGYAYDHSLFGYPFENDFRKVLGGLVYAPPFAYRGTSFSEQYAYTYTAYDYPHQVGDGTATFTIGHNFPRVNVLGVVSLEQLDDRFRDPAVAARVLGLPDPTTAYVLPNGIAYPGYFAFAGLSTYRTYSLTSTFNGAGDDRLILSLVHTHDFPQAFGFGRPPLTLGLEVVRRLTPLLRVDIGRQYTFGWDGRYLSPQYSLSISP